MPLDLENLLSRTCAHRLNGNLLESTHYGTDREPIQVNVFSPKAPLAFENRIVDRVQAGDDVVPLESAQEPWFDLLMVNRQRYRNLSKKNDSGLLILKTFRPAFRVDCQSSTNLTLVNGDLLSKQGV
jgi:hypothetical protein